MILAQSSEGSQCPKYCLTSCRTYGLKRQQRLHLIFKNLFSFQKESKSQCGVEWSCQDCNWKNPHSKRSSTVRVCEEPWWARLFTAHNPWAVHDLADTLLKGTAALLGLVPRHKVLFPEPFVLPSLQLGARVPSQMFCPPTLSDRDDLNTIKSFEKGKITDEGI